MNSEQLHYFLSVAKHLNFTEAAKDFYITQPAISRQISELERELGTKLFHRSTRNVTLTKSGELFLEDAKRFLALEESSKERIRLADSSSELSLKISYLSSPCKSFLPEVVNAFHKLYPQVNITLTRRNAQEISASMQQQDSDLYFSLFHDLETSGQFSTRQIFTDYFCIVCRNDHPCFNDSKVDFNKIATEPFLMCSPENAPLLVKQILQVCRELHFSPRITHYYESMEEILFATESGLGISILPYRIKDYMSISLAYIPLTLRSGGSQMGVAWNQNTENQTVSWFLDVLSRMQEEHPELF